MIRLSTFTGILALALMSARCFAEDVTITIPGSVSFAVTRVLLSTTGSPNPFVISFTNGSSIKHHLNISVIANAVNFTAPSSGRSAIPASNVSWTTSNAVNGTGTNGTLSASVYTLLYVSINKPTTGSVGLTWSLAAPGANIHAGAHTLTVRWKLESI